MIAPAARACLRNRTAAQGIRSITTIQRPVATAEPEDPLVNGNHQPLSTNPTVTLSHGQQLSCPLAPRAESCCICTPTCPGLDRSSQPAAISDQILTANSPTPSDFTPVHAASKWIQPPSEPEPQLKVLQPDHAGSLLLAALPPSSHIITGFSTSIGYSSNIISSLSREGGWSESVSRKAAGGPLFFQQYTARDSAGDVLITPKSFGSIDIVSLDGSRELYIRRKNFLAATPHIAVDNRLRAFGLSVDGLFNYKVSGRGQLALQSCGTLYRIHLKSGEQYIVHPSYIVGWDTSVETTPLVAPSTPHVALEQAAKTQAQDATASASASTLASRIGESITGYARAVKHSSVRTVLWVLWAVRARVKAALDGDKGLYRLEGPGDIYISSHAESSSYISKILTTPSLNEDQARAVAEHYKKL
ncbi:mitochondrial biogenesis AIM24-domain-containing protein [Polychytrium aggregatum]|uniref:mitochondrial biogenesis AIM24-domain-containing protein n=1 Tax=Polychytrium aggregatum TaxID=110093 RepID=UPI0022FE7EE4|nr:mitochondrial biogenesis AIM24-domain-containing protein [Polychytrium aggregatum]KAI9193483.1 mitochondrial biogenesis AIM24-domain-containing protein [Polychytrium aggregatum]